MTYADLNRSGKTRLPIENLSAVLAGLYTISKDYSFKNENA